jgi:hypothetical protein
MNDETLRCKTCGHDFGISIDDPYADPTCPECIRREVEGEDDNTLLSRVQDVIETLEDVALDLETGGPIDPQTTYDELERLRDELQTIMAKLSAA